jgi:prepilin-type N-terminal cleavage/methylation domain-containing protein
MRKRHGFTLVELMVSVAIIGIVMIYVLQTFTSQQRTYVVVDQIAEVQQNSRAVADLLERDLRHAGLMVPESAALCGVDQDAAPDRLYASDADAVDPGDDTSNDFGARLPPAVTNVASGPQNLTVDSLVIEPNPPWRPAYDSDGDGTDDSDFRVNGGVIVTDLANPVRGAACGTVTAILSATSLRVDILTGALGPVPLGGGPPQLVAVPAHEYMVNAQMQLLRDGLVLVEEVEDLQFALFFDGNDDGVVDPGEYLGDDVGADYVSGAVNGPDLREARFNLVLRTRDPDPRQQYSQGQFQNTENRAPVVGADGFRRRVHTATVLLRNLGNRGVTL